MDDSTNSVIVAPNKPVRDILKHLSENDPHLKYEESGVAEKKDDFYEFYEDFYEAFFLLTFDHQTVSFY